MAATVDPKTALPTLPRFECEEGPGFDSDAPKDTNQVFKTWERRVVIAKDRVTKSEIPSSDFLHLPNGIIMSPFWAQERLRNEAATLNFVASNTTIPVPACHLHTDADGLLHLSTTRITNGILLLNISPPSLPAAMAAVDRQIHAHILPQLRSLRRNSIGSVDATLPVFPPHRIYGLDRRSWPRITASETETGEEFVLCHNDLGPQNIFVDPDTFKIVGIIDWEFAGFFPEYFELPLWKEVEWAAGKKMYDEARDRDLAFFGLTKDDLGDCTKVGSS